jgi:hypothetical protein
MSVIKPKNVLDSNFFPSGKAFEFCQLSFNPDDLSCEDGKYLGLKTWQK